MVAAGGFICLASAACLLLTLAAGQTAPQAASQAAQVNEVPDRTLRTPLAMPHTHPCIAAAAAAAAAGQPSPAHLLPSPQPSNDIDSFVRVVDDQFVVGPSCKRFLVTGWNQ